MYRCSALIIALFMTLCFTRAAWSEAPFHIGLVTGTELQGTDEIDGAEAVIKEYGLLKDGGYIVHVMYVDEFMDDMEETINLIASLADDPKMKVIVVNQAIPGTSAAFKRVYQKRPDIIMLAGEPHEDPDEIVDAAPANVFLAVGVDNVNRGYTIPYAAQMLKAKKFVHISFPRHMSYETLRRRKAIMQAASEKLGLEFHAEEAPDPIESIGIEGARAFIEKAIPRWLEKYGKETAFFCTNDAHTEPLIKGLLQYGGLFPEADLPSPLMGYPGALGLEIQERAGDNWPAIVKQVEDAVLAANGSGRFGTWSFSYGYATTAGLAEFGKRVVEGSARIDSLSDLQTCYEKYTPGADWSTAFYTNAETGQAYKQYALVYQDTYIFGLGYLGLTQIEIPEEYYTISE